MNQIIRIVVILALSIGAAHADETGTVVTATNQTKQTSGNTAAYVGAAGGAYLAHSMIHSNNLILTVGGLALGALTGAAVGHQVDNAINQASYQTLTVQLRSGSQVTVITSPSVFGRRYAPGDFVEVSIDSLGLAKIK